MAAPKQPTTQVRQPDSPDTKTIRSNDPVTNREEERLANEALEGEEWANEQARQQQEDEARQAQEDFQEKQDTLKAILDSPEGFVVREEGNTKGLDLAIMDGSIYYSNVQSGKGGLDVQERAFLSGHGYEQLRTAFGPSMGRK